MIPIFSDASLEMQDGANHEPAEFLELIHGNRVERNDPVLEILKEIHEKEETDFLSYDDLKAVNDYILRNYGDRPKNEYGALVAWNELL
jgi:hypothetical protein